LIVPARSSRCQLGRLVFLCATGLSSMGLGLFGSVSSSLLSRLIVSFFLTRRRCRLG
jgi:hypothetical protein